MSNFQATADAGLSSEDQSSLSSQEPSSLSSQEFIRYSRQIMLDQWGEAKQLKLGQAHVVIIGAGGLANIAASYLAGAGIGRLSIIDEDEVELSNLPRQIAFDLDSIENSKVYELANRLREQNDHIEIISFHQYLDPANIGKLVRDCDLVLDCTDNTVTRHLVNRHCVEQKLPLLSASVAGWHGQLLLVDPEQPQWGCYHCLFPQISSAKEAASCQTLGVAGPMVGVLASFQASQALRYLIDAPSDLASKLVCINGENLAMQSFGRVSDSQCLVCATQKKKPKSQSEHQQ
ncbi:MAG: HesA/MoeB/ThiF family protein [Gammaproteobacteria bacterium]|nr:HesA/MoeB/ThiF family protein [Gammaproteobacteria bacterium]